MWVLPAMRDGEVLPAQRHHSAEHFSVEAGEQHLRVPPPYWTEVGLALPYRTPAMPNFCGDIGPVQPGGAHTVRPVSGEKKSACGLQSAIQAQHDSI